MILRLRPGKNRPLQLKSYSICGPYKRAPLYYCMICWVCERLKRAREAGRTADGQADIGKVRSPQISRLSKLEKLGEPKPAYVQAIKCIDRKLWDQYLKRKQRCCNIISKYGFCLSPHLCRISPRLGEDIAKQTHSFNSLQRKTNSSALKTNHKLIKADHSSCFQSLVDAKTKIAF